MLISYIQQRQSVIFIMGVASPKNWGGKMREFGGEASEKKFPHPRPPDSPKGGHALFIILIHFEIFGKATSQAAFRNSGNFVQLNRNREAHHESRYSLKIKVFLDIHVSVSVAGRRGFLAWIHQRICLSRDHVVINTTALTSTLSFMFIHCFNFTFKWNRNTLTSKLRIRNKFKHSRQAWRSY